MLSFQDKIMPIDAPVQPKPLSFADKIEPVNPVVSAVDLSQPSILEKIASGVSSIIQPVGTNQISTDLGMGVLKGAGSTLKGLGQIGSDILNNTVGRVTNILTGKGNVSSKPISPIYDKTTPESQKVDELLNPNGTAENIGYGAEKIAEFLAPSAEIAKGTKALTGLVKGTDMASGLLRTGIKAGTEALSTGAISTAQQGGINDQVKTNALVGGLFSLAGSGISAGIKALSNPAKSLGEKIATTVIKPNASDMADGFNVKNLQKYDLGGTLEQTMAKTQNKLNDLSTQLKTKLAGSNTSINLNTIYDDTVKSLEGNRAKNFGNIKGTERVLQSLKDEIIQVAGNNGLVSIPEAQLVKQGAGTKGSWVFGSGDPDASAVEKVYNAFYSNLKTAIEKNSPEGVKEINKQISELIPISNAVIRRLPVAQRNSVLGLTDHIGLFGAVFNPKELLMLGASKLSKSGQFADYLTKVADNMKNYQPTTAVGQRILGK